MAKKMKDYQIFKCPYCACEYYDETARKGKQVGNPMLECPNCLKKSYRSTILEPSLIGEKRFFDIKFSSFYGKFRIGLILLYAVFLFCILLTKDMILAICFIATSILLYVLYEAVRLAHRRSYLQTDEYSAEITHSLERLANEDYARMIINAQGMDEDSVYYYELNKGEDL